MGMRVTRQISAAFCAVCIEILEVSEVYRNPRSHVLAGKGNWPSLHLNWPQNQWLIAAVTKVFACWTSNSPMYGQIFTHIIYKGEPCGVVSNSGTPPQIPRLIMISHVLNAILPYPWCRCMFLRKMWDFCENQRRSTSSWLSPAELSVRRIHKAGPVDLCQHIVWERCLELHELHSPWYGGWELDKLG